MKNPTTENKAKKSNSYIAQIRQHPEYKKLYQEARLRLEIAHEIATIRKKKLVSQAKLAQMIDSNQAVISRIENGQENLSLDKLSRIAHALGMKVKFTFS